MRMPAGEKSRLVNLEFEFQRLSAEFPQYITMFFQFAIKLVAHPCDGPALGIAAVLLACTAEGIKVLFAIDVSLLEPTVVIVRNI